jgi:hypothetical protein
MFNYKIYVTYSIIKSWLNFKLEVWETLEQADIESILNSALWNHVPFFLNSTEMMRRHFQGGDKVLGSLSTNI